MLTYLIRHRTTVLLALLFLVVFGLQSYRSLPREGPPDIPIPVVLVTTVWPGVSAEDVESLVTDPLENELAALRDIDTMSSTSAEGASVVSLEFEPDVDIESALQKVRDRVSRARPRLPGDVQEPVIREISFEDFPVLIVALAGDADPGVMQDEAERLQDALERIPGVLDVTLSGDATRQVRVQADPDRLAAYGLSLDDLTSAISQENANVPGGTVVAGDARFLVRVPAELEKAADVEDLVVKRVEGKPVFVRDVARVVDGFADTTTYARMNGKPALTLSITKRSGSNVVEIADAARTIVTERAEDWPPGMEWRFVSDQSRRVVDQVHELQNHVLTALILVVAVSFLALGVRNSLFVALAIPLSLFVTFVLLEAMDVTLNMIVLFSLILVLGMLLDDAIVVIENVYRHLEQGLGLVEASVQGTKQVMAPVISSTATTVGAFLPLLFWKGLMGEFMGFLPRVVIISLTASLGVAVLVLPVLTSRWMKRRRHSAASIATEADLVPADTLRKRIMVRYRDLLAWSIDHRWRAAGLGLGTLVATIAAYAVLNAGVEFFPDIEPDRATLTVRAPDGTNLEATDGIVRRVEAVLAGEPDVEVWVAETGVTGNAMRGSQSNTNMARVSVQFRPHRNHVRAGETPRVESSRDVLERIRAATTAIAGAEITIEKARMGPPVGAAIGVEVVGEDYHEVGALAQQVERAVAAVPGVTDLTSDYRVGRPEMRLGIDRVAARRIGASTLRVASEIRTALTGARATAIRQGDDEIEVRVELDPARRRELQDILGLRVSGREDMGPRVAAVPLSSVARFELAGGTGSIRHIDRDRVVTLTGDVLAGYNEDAVRKAVERTIDAYPTGEGQLLRMGGVSEDQQEAMAFLSRAFLVGLALILVALVLHFDSLAVPVMILSSVVLSLVGVLWGLVLTRTPFGVIMTGLGIIALAGVVTKNAIVLLDYVRKLEDSGRSMRDALVEAGLTRFRPVLLTAFAAVIGLVPLALGLNLDYGSLRVHWGGSSAEMWGPMAIAIIFGLTVATLLTLVMVPTFYSIWADIRAWAARLRPSKGAGLTHAARVLVPLALLAGGATWSPPAEGESLEEVLAAVEANNPDVALLGEQVVAAEAQRGRAVTTLLPRLTGRGGWSVNQYEVALDFSTMLPEQMAALLGDIPPIVVQPKEYWSGSATVTQPLFNAQAWPLLRGAGERLDAAEADRIAQRQRIRGFVTRLYYGLGAAREAVSLAEQGLDLAEAQHTLAERQVAAGFQPERARLQAGIAVARAHRDVDAMREVLVQSREAFAKATGLSPDVEVATPTVPDPPATFEAALSIARAERADVAAARARARAADLAVRATDLAWLPTVDGTFNWNYSENTGFSDHETQWMGFVTASWNLWDGGARLAQHREAASGARSAALLVEKREADVAEEVRNAWARRDRALAAFASLEAEVRLAEENLRLAETGFRAGSVTWLDVEAARVGLSRARLGLVQERMNRDVSTVDVLVAIGRYGG